MSKTDSIFPCELRRLASERGQATALRQKALGIWESCSWQDLVGGIDQIAAGLLGLQVQPGEVVSIVSSTCRDWALADLGGQSAGAVVAGLHVTDAAAAIHRHLLSLAVRVLFVEDDALFETIMQAGDLPLLKHVVVFRTEGLRRATDPRLQSLQELRDRGAQALIEEPTLVERALASRGATDGAIVVSTSGTTAGTRVLTLSHQAVTSACSALSDLPSGSGERLLFLPLSHAVERIGALYTGLLRGAIISFVEGQDTVFDNLREVQPEVLQAVPRFWERLRSNLVIALNEATATEQWFYRRAIGLGERLQRAREAREGASTAWRWAHGALNLMVLGNLRRMMGLDRLRLGVVVGAPASAEMMSWYRAVGVDLRHAWGSAEFGGYICIAGPDDASDTVGQPLPGLEVRVGDRGELLVRSNLFPSDKAWHRTGDLGRMDSSGQVDVTGRLDDVIVIAGGQEVQPAELERRMRASPYVADAVVVGDARPHLACLVVLNREAIEQWAQKRQVPFSDMRSLCESAEVGDLISSEVKRTAGSQSPAVRAVKPIDLIADGDPRMYTPALTLKRISVLEQFAPTIEGLYRPASF